MTVSNRLLNIRRQEKYNGSKMIYLQTIALSGKGVLSSVNQKA